jgi:hypothetical protein
MDASAVPEQLTQGRKWSEDERVNALTVLASCGGNIERASRECGVPASTLRFWRDRPMSGRTRAGIVVRSELLAQSIERLLWRLLRSAKGKISGAKLPAVLNGFSHLFDRLRLLRADVTAGGNVDSLPSATVDLSRLSADELRILQGLMEKASAETIAHGAPLAIAQDVSHSEPEQPIAYEQTDSEDEQSPSEQSDAYGQSDAY